MATLIEELDKLRGENSFLRSQGLEPTGFGSLIEGGSQGGLLETLGITGGAQEPTQQTQQIPQGGLDELITMQLGGVDEGVSGVATGQTGAESLRFGTPPPDLLPPQAQPQRQVQPRQAPIQAQRSSQSQEKVTRALARLLRIDPSGVSAKFAQELIVNRNAADLAETQRRMDEVFKETSSLLRIEDPAKQERAILNTINERTTKGLAFPKLEEILRMPRRDRPIALQRRKTIATDVKTLSVNEQKELDRESAEGIAAESVQARRDIAAIVKPATKTSLEKNLDAAGITDPAERKKIIVESITKPGTQININEGLSGFKVPKSFMFDKDETGKIIGIKPIPGSKADRLGAGDAAKVQMIRTAQKAAKGIRELIFDKFDKKGAGIELNSTNLFNAAFNTPFTDGRKLRIKMEFGIQGITRAETGAAMPPAEVDNTRIRFMPSMFDTAEIGRLKLEMFDDFLSGTLQLIDPSGRFNEDRFGNPVKPTFDKSGNAVELGELNEAKFDAELQRRLSGTAQTGETGNVIRFDAQGNRL